MSKYLHLDGCRCGKAETLETDDAWWVNAPEFHNCFHVYFRHNTRVHTLSEVAKLLGVSISAITSVEKKAFAKLRTRIKAMNSDIKK